MARSPQRAMPLPHFHASVVTESGGRVNCVDEFPITTLTAFD